MDKWLYPEDLDNIDYVINIHTSNFGMPIVNIYQLPTYWSEKVEEGYSLHDIMEQV